MQRWCLIVFCLLLGAEKAWSGSEKVEYPVYRGVDCTVGGGHPTGWEDLGYHDEYCAHIVCEEPGLCAPHGGAYVYEIPPLDYRGMQVVTDYPGGSTVLLRGDGGAISWGDVEGSLESSRDLRHQLKSDVREIYASRKGFVVVKNDGTLLSWLRDPHNHIVPHTTDNIAADLASGIEKVFSGSAGFVALTGKGSWVSWAGDDRGQKIAHLNGDEVQNILINEGAQVALKKDGSVIAWGDVDYGGKPFESVRRKLQGIVRIYATSSAFAALKRDGTVIAWGNPHRGGNTVAVSHLIVDVEDIVSTNGAFAALKRDGTVVTWGEGVFPTQFNVKKVVASRGGAFAALTIDDAVITWGAEIYGGDMTLVAFLLQSDVADIYANYSGFAALKKDGSVVSWGEYITTDETLEHMASYLVAREEMDPKRIETIVSSPFGDAFFGVRADGTFVSWGRGVYPYHSVFYDILDDPVWSKVYPDLEYVHYFDILPKKRQ